MPSHFIERVRAGQAVDFQESMAVIGEHYDYQPTQFSNGIRQPLINEAGRNEGSCKIFAFAKLQGLDQAQTLALFGDYYRKDVLENPDGTDHQNIRNFMRDGWDGIVFSGEALTAKHAD
ncbi:HopJ type III effector protein [Methylomonas sp. LL1]|uniref:HopJ type III effector protein n=1 Tax=Methylomonas sp. LL1 TaxID=2785785 RepID=UPI0018C35420|nr:HopJ type III effector protein [Methylomonas sp. LL1]QPK64884.1 HopJ type III effector protein [Methylomonas sp. LL1]